MGDSLGNQGRMWPLTPRESIESEVEAQDETLPQEGENDSPAGRPEAAPERRVATGEDLKKNARQPSIGFCHSEIIGEE